MRKFKNTFIMVLALLAGFANTGFANPWANELNDANLPPAAGDVLIVEIGYGITRCGLSSQENPVEFASNVRWDYTLFKNDFRNMLNQVYTKLNISDKSSHPVFVLEPDGQNSYRRVDMAEVIMGENQSPWMYVMWNSYITLWGNDNGSSSGVVYHADNNHSCITPIVGGWPYDIPYRTEFDYHEPEMKRRADSLFWTSSEHFNSSDRKELIQNLILSGNNFQGISASEVQQMKERMDIQRFSYDEMHTVNAYSPVQHTIWRAAKKMALDGMLVDMDFAFQQSHFQSNGAGYIRQWVF